jgi:capsular polysaccharide biosynthesis protein
LQQITEGPFSRETTVLDAMARYRWMVLLFVLGFAALGFIFAFLRQPSFDAVATIFLEEPTESAVVGGQDTTTRQFGQFLAEQEALLQSATIAERAAEIVGDPDSALTPEDFLGGVSTTSNVDTGRVNIFFRASTAANAVIGANSIARAYEDIRLQQIQDRADLRAERLDAAVALVAEDLAGVRTEIDSLLPPQRARLDAQLDQALAELVELRERRSEATGEELAQIRAQLDDLFAELQTSNLYRSLEAQQRDLAPLVTRESDLLELEQELANRRQLALIDGELADPGIALFSLAQGARQQGIGLMPLLVVMAILGAVVGGFLAYYLALRRQRVLTSRDPQIVLSSPLLAEIPLFSEERIRSPLPVDEYPDSGVSEAFRFLASSIIVRHMSRDDAGAKHAAGPASAAEKARTLAFVSASLGDGKTTTVANAALAAARAGNRVLVIDGDFSSQELMRVLTEPESQPRKGITDVVLAEAMFLRSVVTVERRGGGQLDVIGRGLKRSPPATSSAIQVSTSFSIL